MASRRADRPACCTCSVMPRISVDQAGAPCSRLLRASRNQFVIPMVLRRVPPRKRPASDCHPVLRPFCNLLIPRGHLKRPMSAGGPMLHGRQAVASNAGRHGPEPCGNSTGPFAHQLERAGLQHDRGLQAEGSHHDVDGPLAKLVCGKDGIGSGPRPSRGSREANLSIWPMTQKRC